MIKAKHDADSATLWAMSEIYAAKAIVETVDVDRLFDKSIAKRDKAREHATLAKAAARFRKADQFMVRAANACQVVMRFAPADEALLLQLDLKTFESASKAITGLADAMEGGVLPPNRPIHGLMAILRDQDVIAERRAVAYQGLPGHLPKDY